MERREAPKVAKDVVCGMMVDTEKPAATSNYAGKTYFFCNPSCKQKFDANRGSYVAASC